MVTIALKVGVVTNVGVSVEEIGLVEDEPDEGGVADR